MHSDIHHRSAEDLFTKLVQGLGEKYYTGRYMYVNAWRNIATTPIVDDAFAVCDASTVVSPDDYVPMMLYGQGYENLQYNLDCRNAARHKWYFFDKQQKDEVVRATALFFPPNLSPRSFSHATPLCAACTATCTAAHRSTGAAAFSSYSSSSGTAIRSSQREAGSTRPSKIRMHPQGHLRAKASSAGHTASSQTTNPTRARRCRLLRPSPVMTVLASGTLMHVRRK